MFRLHAFFFGIPLLFLDLTLPPASPPRRRGLQRHLLSPSRGRAPSQGNRSQTILRHGARTTLGSRTQCASRPPHADVHHACAGAARRFQPSSSTDMQNPPRSCRLLRAARDRGSLERCRGDGPGATSHASRNPNLKWSPIRSRRDQPTLGHKRIISDLQSSRLPVNDLPADTTLRTPRSSNSKRTSGHLKVEILNGPLDTSKSKF